MFALSTPARLMVRPFRGYTELALLTSADGADQPTVTRAVTRFLFVFGAFVSLTATGRLAPNELLSGMLSFTYVPLLHAIAVTAGTRVVARGVATKRVVALYAEGYGPWLLLMLLVAGGSLFAPAPARLLSATSGWLGLGTMAWSALITFAFFKNGLGLSLARAAIGCIVHYVIIVALVLSYFLAAGQLLPIL
jgi:hypothetical protein